MTDTIHAGVRFPALDLRTPKGEPGTLPSGRTVVYFMRTATCPICNSHLRQIARGELSRNVVVIVPGLPSDAAAVARRHGSFEGRVFASDSAHERVGLFVAAGLQRSGTFVVDADGTVMSARASTVPTGAFSASEVAAAMAR